MFRVFAYGLWFALAAAMLWIAFWIARTGFGVDDKFILGWLFLIVCNDWAKDFRNAICEDEK